MIFHTPVVSQNQPCESPTAARLPARRETGAITPATPAELPKEPGEAFKLFECAGASLEPWAGEALRPSPRWEAGPSFTCCQSRAPLAQPLRGRWSSSRRPGREHGPACPVAATASAAAAPVAATAFAPPGAGGPGSSWVSCTHEAYERRTDVCIGRSKTCGVGPGTVSLQGQADPLPPSAATSRPVLSPCAGAGPGSPSIPCAAIPGMDERPQR